MKVKSGHTNSFGKRAAGHPVEGGVLSHCRIEGDIRGPAAKE